MSVAEATACQAFLADIESLWECLDAHFGSLGPADWSRPHGRDWVYADLPYHLSYFDRIIVARPLALGRDLPASERPELRTMADINAWNARNFAARPAGQTPEQSVAQMRASREAVRQLILEMTDADLNRPVWMPFFACDFLPAIVALDAFRAHTYAHEAELRLRLGRTAPVPNASATHASINTLLGFFPFGLNREQAANERFTLVLEITGHGGGAWTVRVADGNCMVSEERASEADLVISQSADTFIKTRARIHDPVVAIQTGEVQIQGMENMGRFVALFPPPPSD